MLKCKHCGKEFEHINQLKGHLSAHSRGESYKKKRKSNKIKTRKTQDDIHNCKFCGKIYEDYRKLAGHTSWCKLNPNREAKLAKIQKINRERDFSWSKEDRKRLSEIRINYLKNHPEKVPYRLNHSSKMSYPEKIFENALVEEGITGWIYNYKNGIYSYDFGFPNLKIDVEIDGFTHLQEKVKQIDKRRDDFSKSEGWVVLRFTAKKVKSNVISCIKSLKKIIDNRIIPQ